jgi:hypothetical protein
MVYYVSCKNDNELYEWMDEIYKRISGLSTPTDFKHQVHVGFDYSTGEFTVFSCLIIGNAFNLGWLIKRVKNL